MGGDLASSGHEDQSHEPADNGREDAEVVEQRVDKQEPGLVEHPATRRVNEGPLKEEWNNVGWGIGTHPWVQAWVQAEAEAHPAAQKMMSTALEICRCACSATACWIKACIEEATHASEMYQGGETMGRGLTRDRDLCAAAAWRDEEQVRKGEHASDTHGDAVDVH